MLDYISILAGGSCKFNCEFCVGNSIRENITPHYSSKIKGFLECYADRTQLLSVSGDTSDPSLISETIFIPVEAKEYNKDIKVSIHTRDIYFTEKAMDYGYDKIVLSIDETLSENDYQTLVNYYYHYGYNIRLSFVLTSSNFWIIDEWKKDFPALFDMELTIRPDVFEKDEVFRKHIFLETFLGIDGDWQNIEQYKNEYGAIVLEKYPNVWYWDYNVTNKNLDVLYLFSNGDIKNNCKWENLYEN